MAITKTFQGLNEDGSPHYLYETDDHAVVTGPAYGPVTCSDGTVYDVSEPVIEVASETHAGEVAHLIGVLHEEQGHPSNPALLYIHECTDSCGKLRREG